MIISTKTCAKSTIQQDILSYKQKLHTDKKSDTRSEIDNHHKKGQIILTGSSTPKTKGIVHSGAGRIVRLKMNTMSLYESGDSSGKVSLPFFVLVSFLFSIEAS